MATGREGSGGKGVLRRQAGASLKRFSLRLYITGQTTRSSRCLRTVRILCEEYLDGDAELEVVDIYQQPDLAREAQILAAPTLVKNRPLPIRKLVGDLQDLPRVLGALGVIGSQP